MSTPAQSPRSDSGPQSQQSRQQPSAESVVSERTKTLHKTKAPPTKEGNDLVLFGTKDVLGIGSAVDLMDVGAGKDGVMSVVEADALERRVMESVIVSDDGGSSLWSVGHANTKMAFLVALRVYLAMHSSENADDGSGGTSDGVKLTFGSSELSGADLKVAAGVKSFNRYLRCRADEVSASIKFILGRARLPNAANVYPSACSTARLLQVNARKRYVAEFPQFAFVGAEYCSAVTPRVAEILEEAKRTILAERSSESPGTGGRSRGSA